MALPQIYMQIHDGEWRSMNKNAECHHRRGAACDYICLVWKQQTNPSCIERHRIENTITCQLGSRMTAWRVKKNNGFPNFRNYKEAYNDLVAHERPDKATRKAISNFLLGRWRNDLDDYEADNGAVRFVEASKINYQHWATWIPPELKLESPKQHQQQHPSGQKFVPWSYDPPVRDEWFPQPHCPFLTLPAELRVAILRLVLQPDHNPTDGFGKELRRGRIVGTVASWAPCIARTCRQLWIESMPIFYGENTFIFHLDSWFNLSKAKRWVRLRRNRYIGHLQNIILLGFDRNPPAGITGHVAFPNGQIGLFGGPRIIDVQPVRVGINLKNFTYAVHTKIHEVTKWIFRMQHVVSELRKAANGLAVSDVQFCRLLEIFGEVVEEVEDDKRARRKVFEEGQGDWIL